jgi:hypothetical protein
VSYYRCTAEGLLLQALGPLAAGAETGNARLQRLLESARNLGDPGIAQVACPHPLMLPVLAPKPQSPSLQSHSWVFCPHS